ncbi:hypothetical protein KAR34_02325 [bacterium]|nr:hypothetical protein [bacterium]
MKKLLAIALTLGLCGAAAIYLSSCAQLSGPLSPELTLLSANSQTADKRMPTVGGTTAPGSVSDTAKVYFIESGSSPRMAMDPNTLNTSTVLVYTQNDDGLGETLYSYTVSYNATNKEITITPSGGTWTDDKHYHVVITTGCQSMSNIALDGNGNRIPESETFDNVHFYFSLGSAITAPGYTSANKELQVTARVEANGFGPSTLNFGGSAVGNVRAAYSYVTITVVLSVSGGTDDPNIAYDTSTFFPGGTSLHSNIELIDSAGNVPSVVSTSNTTSVYSNDALIIVLQNVPANIFYELKIKGGTNGIRSSSGAALYVNKPLYLDGDGDGKAEANDDTKVANFGTAQADNTDIPRLCVSLVTPDPNLNSSSPIGQRRIQVSFTITSFYGTGTLDPATITNQNFRLINENPNPDEAFLPTALELDNSTPGAPVVYVYVPLAFEGNYGNGSRSVTLLVRNVKTNDGAQSMAMDQDTDHGTGDPTGDGVAGTDEDYYSGSFSVYHHGQ